MATCASCEHFHAYDAPPVDCLGICSRFPPVLPMPHTGQCLSGDPHGRRGVFPEVPAGAFCGEYRERGRQPLDVIGNLTPSDN